MIWPSIMVLWWQAESSPSQVIYGVFCEVIIEDRPYYNGTAQFHASAKIFYQMSAVFFFFFFFPKVHLPSFILHLPNLKCSLPNQCKKKRLMVTQLPLIKKKEGGGGKDS